MGAPERTKNSAFQRSANFVHMHNFTLVHTSSVREDFCNTSHCQVFYIACVDNTTSMYNMGKYKMNILIAYLHIEFTQKSNRLHRRTDRGDNPLITIYRISGILIHIIVIKVKTFSCTFASMTGASFTSLMVCSSECDKYQDSNFSCQDIFLYIKSFAFMLGFYTFMSKQFIPCQFQAMFYTPRKTGDELALDYGGVWELTAGKTTWRRTIVTQKSFSQISCLFSVNAPHAWRCVMATKLSFYRED